jgi:hypothetical protein
MVGFLRASINQPTLRRPRSRTTNPIGCSVGTTALGLQLHVFGSHSYAYGSPQYRSTQMGAYDSRCPATQAGGLGMSHEHPSATLPSGSIANRLTHYPPPAMHPLSAHCYVISSMLQRGSDHSFCAMTFPYPPST